MPKTIIVSNRLPVKVKHQDSELVFEPSEGGLATGLGCVYKQGNNCWIGWPGMSIKQAADREKVTRHLKQENMLPVFLTQTEVKEFYEGFSNETLWPAFHYFLQYIVYNQKLWETYKTVNYKFCEAVVKQAEPGDTIWIHDYQLLLLPQLIREKLPDISIGFFQHIPFPSYEVFRLMPWREEILKGMLGADLIGFHTYDDNRHFLSSVRRILGYTNAQGIIEAGARSVMVDAFPMGIDYDKYATVAASEEIERREQKVRSKLADQKLILSIDRLDYSKGIPQRLLAYEQFLKKYPQYKEQVTLMMVVVPSRDQVPQYKELKEEVDLLVGRINGTYRTLGWDPIVYFYRSFSLENLSAFYRTADVALVTPMRDGMNLVCKEFIASKTDQTGVLILSELAGAAKELTDALLINPNDSAQVVEALHTALSMPVSEQKVRISAMQQSLQRYNVHHWVELFMNRLSYIKLKQLSTSTIKLDGMPMLRLEEQYKTAQSRLIILDYDGTIIDYKKEPLEAGPDEECLQLLHDLTEDAKNRVVIISSRDRHTLDSWLGELELDLVAEHGVWKREKGGKWELQYRINSDWKQDLTPIMNLYVDRTPGSLLEEREFSLVWHYRKAEKGLGELRARELASHLHYLAGALGLQVIENNMQVEIKPQSVQKGATAQWYQEQYPSQFLLAAGDDKSDEAVFTAMPDTAFTIKVGAGRSGAQYYVENYVQAREVLQRLSKTKPETGRTLKISA
ncbi:MAG: bifunctional alpha,alpha-trehalose-phosphate synthase (UDP-forming)/trehalose-phosphatase [Hymenobacteraceae bacterium]|nr:bifunctional alpha,alpha-trehalose-phosphate synthase (UDP-forming)/trehalose-phosphatase [Hymenobacteraceae bacterium]MDX5396062.1 bifunctional alpha,alpha-trehalose-phosphate synthase (UDP-forming)/trehalose-phosphatase [Hymenobacteraceae bacterium]MDX5442164.1 bifunctional alpha,alpha-trehalose-phosphate synthase (UDP-forming)/trehalose-phosphatase [Hymenobacteraceae bacterium]MDX5512125.1 bifunctional alpha,alpha-trehalose-phosphate synthase (UDP-forming)/trehalose-phosphatase [Hymenobact